MLANDAGLEPTARLTGSIYNEMTIFFFFLKGRHRFISNLIHLISTCCLATVFPAPVWKTTG